MVYEDIDTLVQYQKILQEQMKNKIEDPTTYELQYDKQANRLSWDKSTKPTFQEQQSTDLGPGKSNILDDKKSQEIGLINKLDIECKNVQKPGFDCAELRFKENQQILYSMSFSEKTYYPSGLFKQVTAPFKSQQLRLAYKSSQFTPGVSIYQFD